MVLNDVCGDGAAAVGRLAADGALVGALVPAVVLDRTEGAWVLSSAGSSFQSDLILELFLGRNLEVYK